MRFINIISLYEGGNMEHIGYGEHIANTVRNMPYETAIQTEDIAGKLAERFTLSFDKAKTLTNVKLKRMADSGEIERLQKGVYCHVKQTVFGKVIPSIDKVILKTLTTQNGAKVGYESGASLFNKIGLSTLMPRDLEITTNRYNMKLPEDCHIKVRKPPATISDENWRYFQFIGLLGELPDAHTDAEKPKKLLSQYLKNQMLDKLTLIFTARRYYSQKIVLSLIDLLMEDENETASR